jgi:hypothetical protein
MRREDDEKLWDLLGHSAQPEISPFFARNVLRKLRKARGDTHANRWFSLRRLIPAAGVAVAILAALFLRLQTPGQNHSEAQPDKWTLTETQDSELIADLDDLIAADDNNSWDDTVLL